MTVKGLGYLVPLTPGLANKCSVFTGLDTIGAITVEYVWTSTPAIAPTVFTFTGGTAPIVSGTPFDTIRLPAPSGTAFSGTGSFAPPVGPVINMATNIASNCVAGWGPYPSFTFASGSYITVP